MMLARGSYSWILLTVLIAIGTCILGVIGQGQWRLFLLILSALFFLKTVFLVVFFRDPQRIIGHGIVAVADGKIREITTLQDPEIGECLRISTFMNLQNVHVNRMPLAGTIEKLTHHPGGHVPSFQKESDVNERIILLIRTDVGVMKIVQIAGTVARRIVPYFSEGSVLKKGEKIGLIRLGSRVDLYLPVNKIKPLMIQVHERIKAGETTIAEVND